MALAPGGREGAGPLASVAGQAPARSRPHNKPADTGPERFGHPCKSADMAPERFGHPCKQADTAPEGFGRPCKSADTGPAGFGHPGKGGDTGPEAVGHRGRTADAVPAAFGRAGATIAGRPGIFAGIVHFPLFALMLNPTPFFAIDYFATRDVTLLRLQKFSVDVLQRLKADNPGQAFDALVADLSAYHTALFGAMSGIDAGFSQRRTAAQQMWGALADAQHQLAEDEALIEYKARKTPALHQAFFPNGRSEYSNATLLTAELLLARAAAAATAHAKTLGADFDPAPYAGFLQAFLTGRDGTAGGDQQSAQARAEAQHHRQDLTQRLTDAVKRVAAHGLRDEARAAAYFRFELLAAPAAARPK